MSAHSRASALDTTYVIDPGTPPAHNLRSVGQFRELRLFLPENIEGQAEVLDHEGETTPLTIANISSFGCRLKCADQESSLHLNQSIPRLKLAVDGQVIFDGPATVVNESSSPQGLTYGLALQGYGVDLEKVRAIIETREKLPAISGTKTIMALVDLIRPDFKIQCAHLNALFQDLRMRLNEEEAKIKASSSSDSFKQKLESQAIDMAMALYQHEIHKLFEDFQKIVETLSSEERVIHKRFFRVTIHPLLLSSPFIQRAYTKPLGYAGDYGLMVMFYEYKDLGNDLFEKFMHRFACNEPAAVANKNRVEHLAERLNVIYDDFCKVQPAGSTFKISTIACGPAKEIELFLALVKLNPNYPVHVVLIDQEPNALEYAQGRLRQLNLPANLVKYTLLAEDAVLGIIKKRPFCGYIKDSNCIVSAGLFDYLSDRVAEKLIAEFYELLKTGGQIIVGNVSKGNPDRFSMEYVMEWQLILRDAHDLSKLCKKEWQEERQFKVVSEVLGLNLFLEIQKRG